jgi:transposase InsO family protein
MASQEVPMSVRRLIVEVDASTVNVSEFCAAHGISRWSFYAIRARWRDEGETALEPRSRAPVRVANRTPAQVEDLIVAKRKELDDAGLDAGAGSIKDQLGHLDGTPSESTIWRILARRGFIVAEPNKAPGTAGQRFEMERANESWQLDDTPWALADDTPVKILNVIDDRSRLLVASRALRSVTGQTALQTLAAPAQVLGWPQRFQSDNARAFRDMLAAALRPLGVAEAHSRPYHPQTNGKVERFHQTLKKWLRRQSPAASLTELQTQLDMFRHHYNHLRPHRSLNRATPAHTWQTVPKAGPADRPLGEPTRIYTGTVNTRGYITINNPHEVALGSIHAGQPHLSIVTGLTCHVFIDGRLIRTLTINPDKRVQALHPRPGRPPT